MAAYEFDENKQAIEDGINAYGICEEATKIIISHSKSLLQPSILAFI
jgi:hypothetical protein